MVKKELHPNLELLKRVAKEISPLIDNVVFVGGATTTLYINKVDHADQARGTVDVDMILNANRLTFYKIEEILRMLGFKHDQNTTYRFLKDDLIVDIMPIEGSVLGFTNSWYKEGYNTAELGKIGGIEFRVLNFAYFLATKLEAFNGRGKNDYFSSKDMEDIVTVLAGRKGFLGELLALEGEIKKFVFSQLKFHFENGDFQESLEGHLPIVLNKKELLLQIKSDIREFISQ